MDTKHIQEALQSKKVRSLIFVIGFVVVALMIFAAGMEVGYMKASFSFQFGDGYYRPFDSGENHHGMGIFSAPISGAHGVTGKILSIALPTMVVADRDNTEKVVQIENETVIRAERKTIAPSDLRAGDLVVVIGEPDASAEIEAKFIRVLPPPPEAPAAQ